jgi:hypothetical protein
MPRAVAFSWIDPKRLDDRLDARAFKPWVLSLTDKCAAFPQGTMALGTKPECLFLARGIGASRPTPNSIAVYKAKEVCEFVIDSPEAFADRCPQTKILREKDVVLTSSGIGTIGRAALYYGSSPKGASKAATVDNHVSIIRLKGDRLLPQYVCAFLNASPGKAWSEWGTTGSTRLLELSVDKVARFRLPVPDRRVQEYLGAPVDLANRVSVEAIHLRNRAAAALRKEWNLDRLEENVARLAQKQAHTIQAARLGDRWDAGFYQPWHLYVADELDQRDCWILRNLIHPPAKGIQSAYTPDGGIPALTVTHIDPFVIDRRNASQAVTQQWLETNERARIHPDEVLLTVTGPPLGEAVVVEDFHLPAAVNGDIARIGLQIAFPYPNLLAAMLNSPLGQWQTTRFCKGVRQKHLYPEDLLRFRFPKLPATILPSLEDDFRMACVLLEKARVFVSEAKASVEALIEGTLDTAAILSGRLKPPTYEELVKTMAGKGVR